jgi:hypothetical protein
MIIWLLRKVAGRHLWSADHLREVLSIPERTLRENRRRWGLTAHKVSRAIRFRERGIEAWLVYWL